MKDLNYEGKFEHKNRQPPSCDNLGDEDKIKVSKIPPSAMAKLRDLGVSHWNSIALSVANSLKNAGVSRTGVVSILSTSGASYKDYVSERDINKVVTCAFDEEFNGKRAINWPDRNKELARKIIDRDPGEDLEVHGFTTDCPRGVLSSLYRPTDLLNMAPKARSNGETKTLTEWLDNGIEEMNFIVPSPMSKKKGLRKDDGTLSTRTLDNSGPRIYQVIEFDSTPLYDQPAILHHLASIVPLVLVVHSGGKSLHGHFKVSHLTSEQQKQFMRYAVTLGADKALWSRCQYSRLAGGQEEGRGAQDILMFNPEGSEADIANLPQGAMTRKFNLIHADDITFDTDSRDFVENLLTEGGLSMLYGAPSAGKSFFALDLAVAVATLRQWRDREVDGGPVVYFCLEGQGGFKQRIEAQKQIGNLPRGEHGFYLVETHLSLLKPEDSSQFIATAREQVDSIKMVVIDTLAVSMAGGEENGPDMTAAIEQAKAIGQELDCHVMLVHHTGKDKSRGARGHSSQLGAVDTSIFLTTENGQCLAKVEKQKDFEGGSVFPFKLIPRVIGVNQRGKDITSCTVEAVKEEFSSTPKKGPVEKFPAGDLLEFLPQVDEVSWKAKAIEKGWSDSTFRKKRKTLKKGTDYGKDSEGNFVRVFEHDASEADCF